MDSTFHPPESVRGMTELDESAFSRTISVQAVEMQPRDIGKVRKLMSGLKILELKRFKNIKPIQDCSHSKLKTILLDPTTEEKLSDLIATCKESGIEAIPVTESLDLSFQSFSTETIMNAVLPENVPAIKSFSQVGHIIHLNLRDEQITHGKIIGEIILRTIPACRTVINKANSIDTKFRNFQIDLLAGEADYVTTVKEKGCEYWMDFSKVFWNSRLSTEHERIVKKYLKGGNSVVYDVFAGIGPFSVPAAKKGCIVLANDLNPESVKYLSMNGKKNKVEFDSVHNLDGADFIRNIIGPDLSKRHETSTNIIGHAIMNLPAIAVTFLPNYIGSIKSTKPKIAERNGSEISNSNSSDSHRGISLTVHCHLFSSAEDVKTDAKNLVEKQLEGFVQPQDYEIIEVHVVRNVAPQKEMLCVSMILKEKILTAKKDREDCINAQSIPPAKRFCSDASTNE